MDQSHRLPPIRDVVNMLPQSRATTLQPHAWTAVNHRQEAPGSVSPQAQHAHARIHGSLPSLTHHQEPRNERPTQHQPSALTSIESSLGGDSSASRSPRSISRAAGKPMTPERQDSFLLPAAQPAITTSQTTASFSPETHQRGLLREPVADPSTPPFDPSSNPTHPGAISTHSSAHDTPQELPPMHRGVHDIVPRRERSHSGPTKPTMASLPHTVLFGHGRNSMPPPPIPATALNSPPLPMPAVLSLSSTDSGASQFNSRHTTGANHVEKEGQEKCAHCNATWSFPPLDVRQLGTKRAAVKPEDLNDITDSIHAFTNDYQARRKADYAKWKHEHYNAHCRCTDGKRKATEPLGDSSPASKFQKRSSESPPRRTHPTPPPAEPPVAVGSPEKEPPPKSITYKSEHGAPIQISHAAAMLTGLDGAPRPSPYVRPANDSSNMWHDARGARGKANTEETAH